MQGRCQSLWRGTVKRLGQSGFVGRRKIQRRSPRCRWGVGRGLADRWAERVGNLAPVPLGTVVPAAQPPTRHSDARGCARLGQWRNGFTLSGTRVIVPKSLTDVDSIPCSQAHGRLLRGNPQSNLCSFAGTDNEVALPFRPGAVPVCTSFVGSRQDVREGEVPLRVG